MTADETRRPPARECTEKIAGQECLVIGTGLDAWIASPDPVDLAELDGSTPTGADPCPTCGRAIREVVQRSPDTAHAQPCGHPVSPDRLSGPASHDRTHVREQSAGRDPDATDSHEERDLP